MTYVKLGAVIIALAVINGDATAETNAPSARDYFRLWNDCRATGILVESLSDDAAAIGLTVDRIETMLRSRLRAARIYDDSAEDTYLYVNINVGSNFFGIGLKFRKWVLDIATSEGRGGQGFATTWDIGSAGTHGQNASFILQAVSEQVDKFIDEYLRVNEEAC